MTGALAAPFVPNAGNQLRQARQSAGLRLRGFADALSVSVPCASRWETGVRRPHSSDLSRIAELLGRTPGEVASWFTELPLLSTEAVRDARALRELRRRPGLSRAQLAVAVGVSVATVAHWECGRRGLPAARWPALAGALGMSVPDLVGALSAGPRPADVDPLVLLRRRAGLTQRQVADRLAVSSALISRWERGVQLPTWPHTRRLAVLFGIPVGVVARAVGRDDPTYLDRRRWRSAELGRVLREVRLWRGENRSAVARRAGIHPQTLHRWEAGATLPSREWRRALESALGLPAHSLPN